MVEYAFATEEQRELADEARKILENELKPQIHDLENADGGLGEYPMDVHKIMAETGFSGMNIPEEWGGLGFDNVTIAVILEEMAKVDAGFAFNFYNSSNLFSLITQTTMSDEEKMEWANKMIAGEIIGSFALTESMAGSDAAAMRTSAVKDGDEWVINGTKCFITNAPKADYFVVVAWTDKTKRAGQGCTMFLVEKDRGVKIGKKENKMGLKLSGTAEVIFDDVRVPADHVIGEVGKGFGAGLGVISQDGRSMGSVVCLGIAQAALDAAVEYTKERRQFGKRVCDQQGLAFLMADMQIRTAASRALVYETIASIEKGTNKGFDSSVVKCFVSDNTMQTTVDAVQCLGGYGYMKEYPVEKYMRDAKIFQIFSGTNQIQRRTIARGLFGRDSQK